MCPISSWQKATSAVCCLLDIHEVMKWHFHDCNKDIAMWVKVCIRWWKLPIYMHLGVLPRQASTVGHNYGDTIPSAGSQINDSYLCASLAKPGGINEVKLSAYSSADWFTATGVCLNNSLCSLSYDSQLEKICHIVYIISRRYVI